MASMQDSSSFSLRLFVDKEKNRVVVGEASADFVDTLFSILTLPLGTIVRLVSNNQTHEPVEIGCINNLYTSVGKLDTQVFWNQICKKMLLHPRNPCESHCEKLRLKVDDTEPTKYYMCGSCRGGSNLWLSTFSGLKCGCGKSLDKEMKLVDEEDSKPEAKKDGVFVKASTMYLIFDDLKVLQNSPGNSINQLVQLGYTDFNNLTQISPTVGLKEILELLKRALVSKSALSDVFLGVKDGGRSKPMCCFTLDEAKTSSSWYTSRVCLFKVTVSKSKNKILYAEADGNDFNFLLNFLTMPLGSTLKILDGRNNISVGCMQNLYASVKGLSSSWFTESQGTPLLDLKVASQYGCKKQPLQGLVSEQQTSCYWYGYGNGNGNGVISKKKNTVRTPDAMKLFDPRSADGTTEKAEGFVRRPSVFVVMDDLQVMPMTCASSISFLQKLNVPLDDLEQHELNIGIEEARNLLGASLTSKAALTSGLFYLVKKAKEEGRA